MIFLTTNPDLRPLDTHTCCVPMHTHPPTYTESHHFFNHLSHLLTATTAYCCIPCISIAPHPTSKSWPYSFSMPSPIPTYYNSSSNLAYWHAFFSHYQWYPYVTFPNCHSINPETLPHHPITLHYSIPLFTKSMLYPIHPHSLSSTSTKPHILSSFCTTAYTISFKAPFFIFTPTPIFTPGYTFRDGICPLPIICRRSLPFRKVRGKAEDLHKGPGKDLHSALGPTLG